MIMFSVQDECDGRVLSLLQALHDIEFETEGDDDIKIYIDLI